VQGNTERWLELCKQASIEQDPGKLLALITNINDLLQAKESQLREGPSERPHPEGGGSRRCSRRWAVPALESAGIDHLHRDYSRRLFDYRPNAGSCRSISASLH
jgi:hypothetical protein